MNRTVLEYCYKDDDLGDPMVNEYHILAMDFATEEELKLIADYSLKINQILSEYLIIQLYRLFHLLFPLKILNRYHEPIDFFPKLFPLLFFCGNPACPPIPALKPKEFPPPAAPRMIQ